MHFSDKSIHFSVLCLQEPILCLFTEIIGLLFQSCSFLSRFKALLSSKPASDSTCIEINYVKYPIFQVKSVLTLNLNGTCNRNIVHTCPVQISTYVFGKHIAQSSGFMSTSFTSVYTLSSRVLLIANVVPNQIQ